MTTLQLDPTTKHDWTHSKSLDIRTWMCTIFTIWITRELRNPVKFVHIQVNIFPLELEQKQHKNESTESKCMLIWKLPPFFPHRIAEWKSVPISKQTFIWTPSSRSHIILALELRYKNFPFEKMKWDSDGCKVLILTVSLREILGTTSLLHLVYKSEAPTLWIFKLLELCCLPFFCFSVIFSKLCIVDNANIKAASWKVAWWTEHSSHWRLKSRNCYYWSIFSTVFWSCFGILFVLEKLHFVNDTLFGSKKNSLSQDFVFIVWQSIIFSKFFF